MVPTEKKLQRQYKRHLNSFNTWALREHAHQRIVYRSLVAIVARTKADQVIEHISKINYKKKSFAKEITLDMANSMKLISKRCFPKAIQVTDRFHVQKLALEAL